MKNQSIFRTLSTIRGNQRACLFTEPLWGIPFNLYVPFVSVYMAAFGMDALQIGFVGTVFLMSQMFWSLLSGVITDKLGRRTTTLIFDLLSWTIPTLLWMGAQNYTWFLVAALFNGAWRITETSWGLLLIEDAPDDWLVNLYSITHIAGLIAGFVAPLAYFFVQRYSVVPTMRVLYGITAFMMTLKFVILYFMTTETKMGKRRMKETKGESIFSQFKGNAQVLKQMFLDKGIILTVLLLACYNGIKAVGDTFWPLLITQNLNIATENLSIFSTIKSLLMLATYFVIVPHLSIRKFKNPLLLAFVLMLCQQTLMILMPTGAFVLVIVCVVLEAVALSMISPLTYSLQMLTIDKVERARMLGLFYAMTMLLTAPLTTLSGMMAKVLPTAPFFLNAFLTLCAFLLSLMIWKEKKDTIITAE